MMLLIDLHDMLFTLFHLLAAAADDDDDVDGGDLWWQAITLRMTACRMLELIPVRPAAVIGRVMQRHVVLITHRSYAINILSLPSSYQISSHLVRRPPADSGEVWRFNAEHLWAIQTLIAQLLVIKQIFPARFSGPNKPILLRGKWTTPSTPNLGGHRLIVGALRYFQCDVTYR